MEVIRITCAKKEEAEKKKQRSKLLFNNDTLSDVKFIVRASQHGENDTKQSKIAIPAHKFVLSIWSPVFFRMFCGEMAENGEQIELPDCEYDGIFELLRYFYTDEVCLNGNNVMQVLYVAEKYMVPCLAKECVKFLKTNVDSSNVFCVLKHAQQYENEDLLGLCCNSLKEVRLKSKKFELFKAVDRWSANECEKLNLAADGPVKRQILGDQIFKNIRFPAMKQSDFMEVVLDSKMLTEEEASNIMNQLSCNLTSPSGLLQTERSSCLRCCRSKATLDNKPRSFAMRNGLDCSHFIEITVDRDIILYGVGMFGNS
ncbi:hypothetical protein ACROYT_G036616 [Oculina patagonica]